MDRLPYNEFCFHRDPLIVVANNDTIFLLENTGKISAITGVD